MGVSDNGIRKVPLGAGSAGSPRLVVFAAQSGDQAEPFWLLRRSPEASIYLGALVDAADEVSGLLEIWVQRIEGFAAAFPVHARTWSNADLDRRWGEIREEIAAADGPATLRLEIEQDPPAPVAADGLCFNPESGRVFCRPAGVIGWRAYSAILRGEPWDPAIPEKWLGVLSPAYRDLVGERNGEMRWRNFLVPRMGLRRGLAELLYLKLALLHDAVEVVSIASGRRGSPFLNLTDEHFGIRLSDAGSALPGLWSARVVLNRAGGAVPIELASGRRLFLPEQTVMPGPYRVPGPVRSRCVTGALRIRKVGDVVDGCAAVEATLQTDEDLGAGDEFRLELRLESAGGVLVIPGKVAPGPNPRDWHFAGTISAAAGPAVVEGATHPTVEVLLHPKLGFGCDLYALGILGLQLLFETPERRHPAIVDDVLQMRDRIPAGCQAQALPAALRELAADRAEFQPGGGDAGTPPRDDLDRLWWETLACVVRMLGGEVSGAYFRNPGDGLEEAPETLFRRPREDLSRLVARARVLVLGENERNREVRNEINALICANHQS